MTDVHAAMCRPATKVRQKCRRSWQVLLIALVAVLVTGCVRSIQPILKDEQVTVDNSLIGQWVSKDGKESLEIEAPPPTSKTYRLLYTDKDGKKADLLGRLGRIGDLTVVELHANNPVPNASNVYKAHLLPVYSFLVVHQTSPQLIVTYMDQDWLKKYLVDHPNDLHVIPNIDDQVITSSTDDIQAFLSRHYKDAGAMGEQGIFIRAVPATTQATAPVRR